MPKIEKNHCCNRQERRIPQRSGPALDPADALSVANMQQEIAALEDESRRWERLHQVQGKVASTKSELIDEITELERQLQQLSAELAQMQQGA